MVEREDRQRLKDLRSSHGILVRYRGGAETWWEISYAGRTTRLNGAIALHDALTIAITGEPDYTPPR